MKIKRINIFIIIILMIYIILSNIKLNYYLFTGGGIYDTNSILNIENKTKKPPVYLAYVSVSQANVLSYMFSYINSNITREKISKQDVFKTNEEIQMRDLLDLNNSEDLAKILAFSRSNKDIILKSSKYYVYDRFDGVKLNIGEEIIKIDGINIASQENIIIKDIKGIRTADKNLKLISESLSKYNVGDYVEIVTNTGKHKIPIKMYKNNKGLGIFISAQRNIQTVPNISFVSEGLGGSSGGLALSLTIYNNLVEQDITHGKKIVATGELYPGDPNLILPVGGIKYKLLGAINSKVDIFIVSELINKSEVDELCKKLKCPMIIGVKTFDEALNKLDKIK